LPEFEINQAADPTVARPETPYLDPDDFADVPRGRSREGLPPKFRMRHASHYVEQLMGDGPIQSVRQIPIDQVIGPDVFGAGERVDVTGISKGKGFTGVMKRHNFHGQGASHGNHKKHRSPGAIGACATPARVFKGMGMPGQHGNSRVTTLNLEVVEGDPERGLLLLRGSVPGPSGSVVFVRDAVKADAGRERASQ